MDIQKILHLVKEELSKKLNKKVNDYDVIDFSIVKELLDEDNILIIESYKDKLNTPFAISVYLNLVNEQNKYNRLVTEDLNKILNTEKLYFSIEEDFSCIINIFRKNEIDIKSQSFSIRYYIINADTNEIGYKLLTNNSYKGWDISKEQLKAISSNEIIIPEIKIYKEKISFWKKWFK